jgi:hypothetical protein
MRISKVSLIVSLAWAAVVQLHSQPASPELQGKALELLRQTISQEGAPSVGQPSSLTQQQQAVNLLRQSIAEDKGAGSATAPQKAVKPGATKKEKADAKSKPAPAPTTSVGPVNAAPVAVDQTAGPKTKQQRLADLDEQYKADKITPAEYHNQRAKILAEP